jgi:hypothetical protein
VIAEKRESAHVPPHLVLELGNDQVSALFWFLQNGFAVTGVEVGCSVRAFITARLGMSPAFIRNCISTIFLDGKPVDDLDTAVIRDGSRLALSSALPGLVGATMRSGGVLASLRSSITYKETGICTGGKGTIHVKLFNMVMEEAGPDLLRAGILVSGPDLETFLQKNAGLIETCRNISFDNQAVDFRSLANPQSFANSAIVRLSVKTISHDNKGS